MSRRVVIAGRRLHWYRYTITGHSREEWHLTDKDETATFGMLKRHEPLPGVIRWGAGSPELSHDLGSDFRRRSDARRALEVWLQSNLHTASAQ